MILFQLGREYKLSVAEIFHVFPSIKLVFVSKEIGVFDGITQQQVLEKSGKLGGTIKVGALVSETIESIALRKEGKFHYGLSVFGGKTNLKKELLALKKQLKASGVSSRFINKDFQNLNSAQIIGEKLVTKGSDFSQVAISSEAKLFQTFWVQDIESYSRRDYDKSRDMQVGMLPPKLCQMMINFSQGTKVYDPFIGLGTVLIEAVHMGQTECYGSDLSEAMVETSAKNLQNIKSQFSFEYRVEKLNAKFIHEAKYLKKADAIVTEGYLGEVMTQKNISLERIEKQKQSLEKLYVGFFSSLQKSKFKGNIIICFPFWEINKKYVYADNLYPILNDFADKHELIPSEDVPEQFQAFLNHSMGGSLLYKRKNQLVGREIYKLTIK